MMHNSSCHNMLPDNPMFSLLQRMINGFWPIPFVATLLFWQIGVCVSLFFGVLTSKSMSRPSKCLGWKPWKFFLLVQIQGANCPHFTMFHDVLGRVSWCFVIFQMMLHIVQCCFAGLQNVSEMRHDVSWCFMMFQNCFWCFMMFYNNVSWCFMFLIGKSTV